MRGCALRLDAGQIPASTGNRTPVGSERPAQTRVGAPDVKSGRTVASPHAGQLGGDTPNVLGERTNIISVVSVRGRGSMTVEVWAIVCFVGK